MHRHFLALLLCLSCLLPAGAQQYFSLRPDELLIDSTLPLFTMTRPLGPDYADSVYEVSIEFPEFAPMKRREARRYRKVTGEKLPEWPAIDHYVGVSRRQGTLYASFVPFIRRDGHNLKLTSFKMVVSAKPAEKNLKPAEKNLVLPEKNLVLAEKNLVSAEISPHSVLSAGTWVKVSVPATGFYELTDSLLLAAGFSDPARVKVYGYGGALQPERLTPSYLLATDDLPQVATSRVGGRRVFYGVGPVNWANAFDFGRQRNPYSDAGYYFLTDATADEPLLQDSAAFVAACYPAPNDYHVLYEVDDYAWYHGGRNLYDRQPFGAGAARSYVLPTHGNGDCVLGVLMSYKGYCEAEVLVDGQPVGRILVDEQTTSGKNGKQFLDSYSKAAADLWEFPLDGVQGDSIAVTIRQLSGAEMLLDRLELSLPTPRQLPSFLTALPQPRLVGTVVPQDLHADGPADMVIVVPASGKLLEEARRLAQLHIEHDGLRVSVVRADQLYNEFSSGTPDANAYRRYLKMLYDRAQSEADMPRFLLLFGDGVYDNRLHTSDFSSLDPDDLLLCYESENSLSETLCHVSDDYFGLLDDGEGADFIKTDKCDVAIGRFPVRTPDEARVMVDKAYSYRLNDVPGNWQNTIGIMGDDGNANLHMNDAEAIAAIVKEKSEAFDVRKIYWDAYQRTTSSMGYAYPDVTQLILQLMRDGALLMNYTGHGSAHMLSHEYVVGLSDFKAPTSMRLPFWFTASCDVAPFDGHTENIAEQAVLNPDGGAIAFLGTTRTVYAQHNRTLNKSFTNYLLSTVDGQPYPIGEAVRLAKNDQVLGSRTQQQAGINKLHFVLLGDPALRLNMPTGQVSIDSINGMAVSDGVQCLLAGDTAVVVGHVADGGSLGGVATLTVKDAEQTITCRLNPLPEDEMPKRPLVYRDRPNTLFTGSDSLRDGRFRITFAVPKDISYADDPGQLLVYAVSADHRLMAHGHSEDFVMASADHYDAEGQGPDISLWLDSPAFVSGSPTSLAPHFHADLADDDGLNASGSGIGHDLELTIDDEMRYTYNLNAYFQFDFGDYRRGSVDFDVPELAPGRHELQFRAWDVLNNSAVVRLSFVAGTAGMMAGIEEVADSRTEARRDEAFDLQGRRLHGRQARQAGLLLVRSQGGKVKKKLVKRQ